MARRRHGQDAKSAKDFADELKEARKLLDRHSREPDVNARPRTVAEHRAAAQVARARKITTKGRTELHAGSGSRLDFYGECTNCGSEISPLWRYSKSNHGPIYVCLRCKGSLLERRRLTRNGKKADPLARALPGSYGSGRRR